jgi:Uma2 family endonuclease
MSLAVRRFTVDEYHRMGEAGVLHEDDRVELLDGQIVQMSPIGIRHAACVNRLNALIVQQAGNQATVSIQNPVILGEYEEPQPDVVVLRYRADGYQTGHPRPPDTLLLVEVADTSVAWDRLIKIPFYARAGIRETWLVNLPEDEIEIYQQPTAGRYTRVRAARRGETLTPLEIPAIALRSDDILGS